MGNCFCCIWPWECGCEEVDREVRRVSDGYPAPPKNILCPCCNNRVDAIYVRADTYCACCFVPCPCCKCGESPLHLACPNCDYKFAGVGYRECRKCHSSCGNNEKYCNNCGERM